MSDRLKSALTFGLSVVILGGLWEWASRSEFVNPLVVPAPTAIWAALVDVIGNLFGPVRYWYDTWITFIEVMLGFFLGVGAALVLGSLIHEFAVVRRIFVPYTVVMNAMPKIAFAPLFIVWFGFGITPKVIMSAFICFFPVLINTVSGLASVATDELELMASIRSSRWQTFRRLKVYKALPYIFAGIRTAMAFAVVGAIIGEFAGAQRGLGFQIEFAAARLETARLFAFLVILSLMAYLLYSIIELIERRAVFWSGDVRLSQKEAAPTSV